MIYLASSPGKPAVSDADELRRTAAMGADALDREAGLLTRIAELEATVAELRRQLGAG